MPLEAASESLQEAEAEPEPQPASSEAKLPVHRGQMLSPRDQQVLDEAVAFINKEVDGSNISLLKVGEYLLQTFFGGDVRKVYSRAPHKGLSLRKLAAHPEIRTDDSTLSRAISLAIQERQLASVDHSQHLTTSHKRALLSVNGLVDKSPEKNWE